MVLFLYFFRMRSERLFLGTQKVIIIYFYLYSCNWLVKCVLKFPEVQLFSPLLFIILTADTVLGFRGIVSVVCFIVP